MPGAARLYPVLLGAVLGLSLIRYDRSVLVLIVVFLIHARKEFGAALRARTDLAAHIELIVDLGPFHSHSPTRSPCMART